MADLAPRALTRRVYKESGRRRGGDNAERPLKADLARRALTNAPAVASVQLGWRGKNHWDRLHRLAARQHAVREGDFDAFAVEGLCPGTLQVTVTKCEHSALHVEVDLAASRTES